MPEWQTIKNAGSILIEDRLEDGPAIRNARQFLHDTSVAFVKHCIDYYDIVGEFPFIYRERQLHSALFPSIAKIADAAFMEQPVTRKTKDISGHGWLDYWILYHTSVFLIELKHSWNAIRTDSIRTTTQESWTEALTQLEKIQKDDDVADLSFTARSVAKIALMVVPFFETSKEKKALTVMGQPEIQEVFLTFVNGLKPAPNWSCAWLLHRKFQEKPVDFENRFEAYPCVGVVAMVKPV